MIIASLASLGLAHHPCGRALWVQTDSEVEETSTVPMYLFIIKHITEVKGCDVAAMKVTLYAIYCWEDDGCVVPGGTVEGSHVDGEPVQYSVLLIVVFVGLLLVV